MSAHFPSVMTTLRDFLSVMTIFASGLSGYEVLEPMGSASLVNVDPL
jgi:hypothetical protein